MANVQEKIKKDKTIAYRFSCCLGRDALDSLISNAVKVSPLGGIVKMKLTKTAEGIIFTIDDEGPGLSEEAQKHIFDKFYQGDTSHKEEGNGLALVKRILTIEQGGFMRKIFRKAAVAL